MICRGCLRTTTLSDSIPQGGGGYGTIVILHVLDRIEELARLRDDWDRLARRELRHFPSFADTFVEIRDRGSLFRVIVARDEDGVEAMACVLLDQPRIDFFNKPLRSRLADRQAVLLGAAILGAPDAGVAAAMLDRILRDPKVILIKLGDVDRASALYAGLRKWRWSWLRHESDWQATRRIIVFPATFKDYLAGLRTSTQRAVRRDLRDFGRLNAEFQIMTRPAEMRKFMNDATSIAAKIPGSDFHLTREARAHRLRHYQEKAEIGIFFGFVSYVDDMPCAYYCGEVNGDVFNALFTAYDPAYRKYCAGTAMLLYVIEYLIENRICARFDFGGRDLDYKARFATTAIDCTHIAMGRLTRPAAALSILYLRISGQIKPRLFRMIGGRTGVR
jgi:hypothetical protein